MIVQSYTEFPDLARVYLEDSYVLGIQDNSGDTLTFAIEAVLTPRHPDYRPPAPAEQRCYRDAQLVLGPATAIRWIHRTHAAYTDATGETDLGNIDSLTFSGDHYEISGDWGEVHVTATAFPRLLLK